MKIENDAFVLDAFGEKEDVIALVAVKSLKQNGIGTFINGSGEDIIKALAVLMHNIVDTFTKNGDMTEEEALLSIDMAVETMKVVRSLMKTTSTEVQ